MDEEIDPESEPEAPVPPKKPSYALSWVTLGFILGALFVLTRPVHRPAPAAPPPPPPAPKEWVPLRLTTIEAVFPEWDKYAVWDGDVTEVALFDAQSKDYSDCYEVARFGGEYFYRTIPQLTRIVLTHGVPDNSPLELTETKEAHDEWLRDVNEQNWKTLQQAIPGAHP